MRTAVCVAISTVALCEGALGANLVANAGFEDGAGAWGLPAQLYAIDTAVAHSGAASLRYHGEPGGPYLLAGQGLPLKPGKSYRLGAWVKVEGIESSDTGAAVALEWVGHEGYIGGAYPTGRVGTRDWERIVYYTAPLPDGVTGGSVIAYGRSGTRGTAWFDDIEVVELAEAAVRFGVSVQPGSSGALRVVEGGLGEPVRLTCETSGALGIPPDALEMTATIQMGGPLEIARGGRWDGPTCTLDVQPSSLPLGQNQIEVALALKADGRPLAGDRLDIETVERVRLTVLCPRLPDSSDCVDCRADRARIRVDVTPTGPEDTREYVARLSLAANGQSCGRPVSIRVRPGTPAQAGIPLSDLPEGLYDLRCELLPAADGPPVATAAAVLSRARAAHRPSNATYFDANRMLIADGKPFFPMGFYMLSSFETVFPADKPYQWLTGRLVPSYYEPILDRLSKSHFNCVMDYGSTMGGMDQARAFMDAAQARGVKCIFSVKDLMEGAYFEEYTRNLPWKDLGEATRGVVTELRDHPALLAWYINDEVIRPDRWAGAVNVFRETRRTDPWHPTWAVHYDYPRIATYRQACDVIGTDPYSLCADIGFTARSWHACREQMPPEQPFWAVVQCFGGGYETSNPAADPREPTYDEERAATMAAIAEGATGIVYYCYHSLQRSPRFGERFAELDRIAAEVQRLVPVISLPDAREPVIVEAGELSVLIKRQGRRTYVLLASTLREDQDCVLRFPTAVVRVRDRTSGRTVASDGPRVKLHIPALDARLLVADDAGSPARGR